MAVITKPYIIGICGGSASGKTFLLNQLIGHYKKGDITLVSQDNYYKDLADQYVTEEGLVNFDHPDSVLLNELYEDVKKLINGRSIERMEYTFNNKSSSPKLLHFYPTQVIILEGLFIYYSDKLANLIDLKIFIEAEEHIKLSRRLRRDHTERGYSIESILRDYEKFVAPMYHQYVAPMKNKCDLIIPNNKHMYKAVKVLANHIKYILQEALKDNNEISSFSNK